MTARAPCGANKVQYLSFSISKVITIERGAIVVLDINKLFTIN